MRTSSCGTPTTAPRRTKPATSNNGEDIKVVQELLRHANARVTMDVYAQAMMPAKRAAQRKLVRMVLRNGEQRTPATAVN